MQWWLCQEGELGECQAVLVAGRAGVPSLSALVLASHWPCMQGAPLLVHCSLFCLAPAPARSSVDLDALCIHECSILGEEGELWPAPTFVVTALDRPDEPLVGKSCTACWSAVSAGLCS